MASQAAQVPFEERMRTLDRVVDEVTQLAQKAASKDEAITTLKHGMTKVINRLRYEIDVAREARDVYKAQRDSLRDDVAALKAACRCGAGSAIPDPVALPPAASGGGGSFRLANSSGPPPAKPASTVKKALPLAPPVASPPPSLSTSPRGAAAAPPPARSPFSVTSAPMGVAAPPMMMAPPANYALSAPPAPPPQQNQQYLALDDISMPQQSEYDHVPPYSAGGGFPPIVSPREGDYRPLPPQAGQGQQQANSRAQYVAVTLNRGTSMAGVPPPYDERIAKIRATLAEATRTVTAQPEAVSEYVSTVEGVVMRLQREIDMARLARDQYHQARDDLWRENEMLRNELAKMKRVAAGAPSSATNTLDLATRSMSERKLSKDERAVERAREVTSTLRLSRKNGSGVLAGSNNKEYVELQTSSSGSAAASAAAAPPDATPPSPKVPERPKASDRSSEPVRDQYQAIDAAIAEADLARSGAAAIDAFPPPPSPQKAAAPPPPGVPPRANLIGSAAAGGGALNGSNGSDLTWPAVDPMRDPNYAPLPVQSKNVPNAVAPAGEMYGEVPDRGSMPPPAAARGMSARRDF